MMGYLLNYVNAISYLKFYVDVHLEQNEEIKVNFSTSIESFLLLVGS